MNTCLYTSQKYFIKTRIVCSSVSTCVCGVFLGWAHVLRWWCFSPNVAVCGNDALDGWDIREMRMVGIWRWHIYGCTSRIELIFIMLQHCFSQRKNEWVTLCITKELHYSQWDVYFQWKFLSHLMNLFATQFLSGIGIFPIFHCSQTGKSVFYAYYVNHKFVFPVFHYYISIFESRITNSWQVCVVVSLPFLIYIQICFKIQTCSSLLIAFLIFIIRKCCTMKCRLSPS